MVTIPSLTAASNFDTGILLAHPLQARALVEHAKQLYAGSAKLETLAAVEAPRCSGDPADGSGAAGSA